MSVFRKIAQYRTIIVIVISLVAIFSYIVPIESLVTVVSGQGGPPPNVPPPDRGGQYGTSKECPPGIKNSGKPVPPGLVGRCP